MSLLLIRIASLVGPRLLGAGSVATTMLISGLLVGPVDQSRPVSASPFESDVAAAALGAPPLINRTEGGRTAEVVAVTALPEGPSFQSATRSTPLQNGAQTLADRLARLPMRAASDVGHLLRGKTIPDALPRQTSLDLSRNERRASLGLSQNGKSNAKRTISASSSVTSGATASQPNLAVPVPLTGQVSLRPGAGRDSSVLNLSTESVNNGRSRESAASSVSARLETSGPPHRWHQSPAGLARLETSFALNRRQQAAAGSVPPGTPVALHRFSRSPAGSAQPGSLVALHRWQLSPLSTPIGSDRSPGRSPGTGSR
jgi:hypothetical protein